MTKRQKRHKSIIRTKFVNTTTAYSYKNKIEIIDEYNINVSFKWMKNKFFSIPLRLTDGCSIGPWWKRDQVKLSNDNICCGIVLFCEQFQRFS